MLLKTLMSSKADHGLKIIRVHLKSISIGHERSSIKSNTFKVPSSNKHNLQFLRACQAEDSDCSVSLLLMEVHLMRNASHLGKHFQVADHRAD